MSDVNDLEIAEVMYNHNMGRLWLGSLDGAILHRIPLRYLLRYAHATELHHIWGKLPISYRESALLQRKLPCFIHHNTGFRTQVDGPPPSIDKCYECNLK